MAQRVTDIYNAWFKIWSTVAVPKLAHRTKWFKPERNLELEDIVYFQKDSSGLDSSWTTGIIDEVVTGPDGLVREVVIRYRNSSENFDRFTTRAARSCVRLHNMDDNNLTDDLHELTERLSLVQGGAGLVGLLPHLDDQNSMQGGSDQSEPSSNLTNLTNIFSHVAGQNTTELTRTEVSLVQAVLEDTPSARRHNLRAIARARETAVEVARPPNAQGVETPVIECTMNNKHTLQARGCLALARARSSSPLHRSPNNFVPAAPSYPSPANTQSLHQTPAGRPLPPHPTRSRVCKQCC